MPLAYQNYPKPTGLNLNQRGRRWGFEVYYSIVMRNLERLCWYLFRLLYKTKPPVAVKQPGALRHYGCE